MWLHVPTTFCLSALASADSNSVFESRSHELERFCTVRGKHTQRRSWLRAWKTHGWMKRLSGLTLPHSTLTRGVDSYIASLRETPANPTASPESNSARMMTDGSSTASSGSSIACGLIVSSAKTCRGTRTDSSPQSSRHWKEWAIALRQEYSARRKLAGRIGESGCSSWPTVNVPTGGQTSDHAEIIGGTAYSNGKKVQVGLEATARQWPTVRACSGERSSGENRTELVETWATPHANAATGAATTGRDGGENTQTQANSRSTPQARLGDGRSPQAKRFGDPARHGGYNLDDHVAAIWSTTRASDGENGGPNQSFGAGGTPLPSMAAPRGTPTSRDHKDGASTLENTPINGLLGRQVQTFLSSPPDQPTPDGPALSDERRTLNPLFVEYLMGWPIGWTACEPVETVSFHWLRLLRGELSRLVCAPPETGLL